MIWLIAITSILALGWLVLYYAKQAAKSESKAGYNEDAAKEIKRQADTLTVVGTDADTLDSLRRKAAAKRKSETSRNR